MKQAVYGTILHRNHILKDLMFVCFINFLIATITYVFASVLLHLPLYGYVMYVLLYLFVLVNLKQKEAIKQYTIFDEEGIHIYRYSKSFYADLIRNKPPKVIDVAYEQLVKCRFTYGKAKKRSTSRYHLVLHLETESIIEDLVINPMVLSSKRMNWVLLMLSVKVAVFEDPYQLSLCLMQQQLSLDVYLDRQEAKKL